MHSRRDGYVVGENRDFTCRRRLGLQDVRLYGQRATAVAIAIREREQTIELVSCRVMGGLIKTDLCNTLEYIRAQHIWHFSCVHAVLYKHVLIYAHAVDILRCSCFSWRARSPKGLSVYWKHGPRTGGLFVVFVRPSN